ncbi:hypothetical protein BDF22DRAFT_742050 [Syncephalis plumigaleata]|nr:hypothetical protein BDF22DRAFT_742050 [Syncephalis plumigaleata]
MSSSGSPDPSEASQKKREWITQADETSKTTDVETVANPDVTRRESQRKKIREEDTDAQSETNSPPNSNRSESDTATKHNESHQSPPTSTDDKKRNSHAEAQAVEQTQATSTTTSQQPSSGSGGFRFGSSKPLTFGSFATKSGASPFAAVTASATSSLSSLPDNKLQSSTSQKNDKTSANVATTVVMAKSNSGDEGGSSEQEESEDDNDTDNGATDTVEGFTVSTLGDESRRKTDVNHVKVVTGEEEEEKLFEMRGKLYEFEDNTWRERGIGLCHININKDDSNSARLVMRRDKTMQVILNTKLVPGMEPSVKDASIYFRGTNVSGEPRSFAIKASKKCRVRGYFLHEIRAAMLAQLMSTLLLIKITSMII